MFRFVVSPCLDLGLTVYTIDLLVVSFICIFLFPFHPKWTAEYFMVAVCSDFTAGRT